MAVWISLFLCGLIAWLTGSIPFSLVVARLAKGIDLRQHGSGNVGATNVARTCGAKWGTLALLMDAVKGGLPVWLLPRLFPIPEANFVNAGVLCGVAAILGHMFPVWLEFRGGKGVATALGVVVVLAPAATGIAFLVFLLTFAATRIVSLSSMLGAIAFAIAQFFLFGNALWSAQNWGLGLFSVAVPALIVLRHWPNILRLLRGEEKQLEFRKAKPPENSSRTPAA